MNETHRFIRYTQCESPTETANFYLFNKTLAANSDISLSVFCERSARLLMFMLSMVEKTHQ